MAFKSSTFSPQICPKPRLKLPNHPPFPSLTPPHQHTRRRRLQVCRAKKISDAELVAELARLKSKWSTNLVQREEAMKKSRDILFQELCVYLGLGEEEMEQKWRKMDEDEKMGWTKGFVSEWGESFHPLSSKSVKEMVDEKVGEHKNSNPYPNSQPSFNLFPSLKRIIGFAQPQTKQNSQHE